ncbi:hypothetical protein EDB84DRAFT_1226779, partial [Lactarius hengduanensis]
WPGTSLGNFCGVRRHQVFKLSFVCGANSAAQLFGRAGGVLGAFLVSGIINDFGVGRAGIG